MHDNGLRAWIVSLRDLANTLAFHLKRSGHDCQVVGDGQTALAEAQRQAPDLIVLNRMLPRMTTAACSE